MPTEYTLSDLVKLTGVSPRTVRYYIAQGLLPSPTQQGPNTRYTEVHLDRLRLIQQAPGAHLPLAEIRRQLGTLPDDQVASLAESTPDYDRARGLGARLHRVAAEPAPGELRNLDAGVHARTSNGHDRELGGRAAGSRDATGSHDSTMATSVSALPPASAPTQIDKPSSEPDRAQWERITLDPDVELHIRRPLTRQQNRRVERLISIARQLLEED